LVAITVLNSRFTLAEQLTLNPTTGLEVLSAWNFSTVDTAANLTIRADQVSALFWGLTILLLFAVMVRAVPFNQPPMTDSIWLLLASGATLLFVAANSFMLSCAVFFFDLCTAFYWFKKQQPLLSIARWLLAIFTSVGLTLIFLNPSLGIFFLGFALWLRLVFYPFHEMSYQADDDFWFYLAISWMGGICLVIRTLNQPLPEFIRWLTAIMMFLSGILAWLAGQTTESPEMPLSAKERDLLLARLALTQVALLLLVSPLPEGVAAIYAFGLMISLTILWLTPNLTKATAYWFYLPVAMATITLLGLPFSLGGLGQTAIYQALLGSDMRSMTNPIILVLVILAEGLALSSLWVYGQNQHDIDIQPKSEPWWSVATFFLMLFLIPGLAQFILATFTHFSLPLVNFYQPTKIYIAMGLSLLAAAGFGTYRPEIIAQLPLSPHALTKIFKLRWFFQLGRPLDQAGKFVLQVRVILEGKHYIGWAFFIALAGLLAVVSSR